MLLVCWSLFFLLVAKNKDQLHRINLALYAFCFMLRISRMKDTPQKDVERQPIPSDRVGRNELKNSCTEQRLLLFAAFGCWINQL